MHIIFGDKMKLIFQLPARNSITHMILAHCSYLVIYMKNQAVFSQRELVLSGLVDFQCQFAELSNPLLFAHHCSCYSKEIKYVFDCNLTQKCNSSITTFLEWHQHCAKSSGFDNSCKKIEEK